MKKGLLLIMLFGVMAQVYAQNVVWSEDFSNGIKDWTINTSECGDITGGLTGEWTLVSATVNGQALAGAVGYFSVGTEDAYIAKLTSGADELYVQGKFSLNGNTIGSNLTGATLAFNDISVNTSNNDTITNYFASFNTTEANFGDLQFAMGIGNPTYTLMNAGQELEITAGNSTFSYQRTSTCGALWFWDQIGWFGSGALLPPTATAQSSTAANGAVVMNPDFYTSRGVFENLPPTLPYPQYFSELISPTIDLSGASSGLELSFYQTVRILNPGDNAPFTPTGRRLVASVAYSTDDGANWSSPLEVNFELAFNDQFEEGVTTVPIPNDVLGQNDVKLRFTFSGAFYYWVLDDLQLVERAAFDMQVNENFLAKYPNVITPASQIDGANFLGDIQNNGGATAQDVQLNLRIVNDQSGTEVYNSTIQYGAITPDSLAENSIFPDKLEASTLEADIATTSNGRASYTGTYTVSHSDQDANIDNDASSFQFFIIDTVFARCDLFNGCFVTGVGPTSENNYTIGNAYYTPNGDGYFARSMAFAASNPEELVGRQVTIFLYEWDGDTNEDLFANPDEYGGAPIAISDYTFNGTEVNTFIDLPLFSLTTGLPPALQDDKFYIIMVQYFTDDDQEFRILATEDNDFLATTFVADSLGENRHLAMFSVGQEGDASTNFRSITNFPGEGDISPLIHLHIGDNNDLTQPPITTSAENLLPEDNIIRLYPNPVEDMVQLEMELTETSKEIDVRIYDQMGKVILNQEFDNIRQTTLNFNVDNLPTGIYLMKVRTDLGSRAMKLIKK